MRLFSSDTGDVIVGWLWKVVVIVLVLGVVGFEIMSIGLTEIQVSQAADDAGSSALQSYSVTHSADQAYQAAENTAVQDGAQINKHSFRVNADGSIEFVIHKTAGSIVLGRFDQTRHWTVVQQKVTYSPNGFN